MTWTPTKLKTICNLRTGKLDSNAAVPDGEFPFFTCAQETYRIDVAAFDTEAVLLGGNNAAGIYPLKYYNGPFNAYQRTYVIESLDKKTLSTRFLYFSLIQALSRFQSASIGAATQYLTKSILDNFEVLLPPIDTQNDIAYVLSYYDDLIENNRRRMVLLEDAARLIYEEWFVRLRFPGHEHATITEGIPVGWHKSKVGELFLKIQRKRRIHRDSYLEFGDIPCVDQSLDFIGGFTDDIEALHTEPLPIIVFGDHTRILKFVDFPFASGADGTQLIYPNRDTLSTQFLYLALGAVDLSNYFYARHFKFLKEEEILLPTDAIMREFTAFAAPCFDQIKNLRTQNQKLRAARDLLLPRLMNGEITP